MIIYVKCKGLRWPTELWYEASAVPEVNEFLELTLRSAQGTDYPRVLVTRRTWSLTAVEGSTPQASVTLHCQYMPYGKEADGDVET